MKQEGAAMVKRGSTAQIQEVIVPPPEFPARGGVTATLDRDILYSYGHGERKGSARQCSGVGLREAVYWGGWGCGAGCMGYR